MSLDDPLFLTREEIVKNPLEILEYSFGAAAGLIGFTRNFVRALQGTKVWDDETNNTLDFLVVPTALLQFKGTTS